MYDEYPLPFPWTDASCLTGDNQKHRSPSLGPTPLAS